MNKDQLIQEDVVADIRLAISDNENQFTSLIIPVSRLEAIAVEITRLRKELAEAREVTIKECAKVAHSYKERLTDEDDWFIPLDIAMMIGALD